MKKFSILSLSLILFGLLSCVSCGYLISTAIVSSNLFQFTSVVSFDNQEVFAISMFKSQTKNEVEAQKSDLQSNKGAGFIYETDGYYHLLASTYENLNDAELVKTNLKNSGYETDILKIKLENIKIEGSFSPEEKNVLTVAIKSDYEVFKSLYDVAISLDTGVFDKTKAKLECNTIFSNHVSTKTNFETIFKKQEHNKDLQALQKQLEQTDEVLSKLISENYESSNQNFSSLIKYSYCEILFK